jgi:hypothetical protein
MAKNMSSKPIYVEEIIIALQQLGGEAQAKAIKDQVTKNRGGIPAHYKRSHSYRETIQKIIEDHCPQSANYRYEAIFQKTKYGRYKLLRNTFPFSYSPSEQVKEKDISYITKIQTPQINTPIEEIILIPSEEDEEVFPEGKEIFRLHKSKERNNKLIEKAKLKKLEIDPLMHCEVCGFSFNKVYGEIGKGFIEAHHIIPIAELTSETETFIKDIVFVCSNCHRMLHRRRPWIKISELKNLLNNKTG